ncbi:hypothetical protein NPIL_445351 [Nephila pilipes]|uniref:Uncharacterized protein n=1 Tax=Nephila pilipes TaxID=299642 RepID=A0A8X6PYH9_NEPPI|nr:hypothetical protein NPIL_445351 [Nephila pilipes]
MYDSLSKFITLGLQSSDSYLMTAATSYEAQTIITAPSKNSPTVHAKTDSPYESVENAGIGIKDSFSAVSRRLRRPF